MTDPAPTSKKAYTADWLFRGLLTKFGDFVDSFTGRRWVPSSNLATSELIVRLKKLLDAEARRVPGKGLVVPHNIGLRMQWDKFSDDSEKGIDILRNDLLTAAADHINDSLYYTFAPISLDVRTDYFTEGVKLTASFDKFDSDGEGVEMDVTMSSIRLAEMHTDDQPNRRLDLGSLIARYTLNGIVKDVQISFPSDGRISVGRTAENALVIDDPSVSKTHASIVSVPGGGLALADTGSTNGTFVNDERLAYGNSVSFGLNDRLKFGSIEVAIDRIEPEADDPKETVEAAPSSATEIGGLEFRSRSSDATTDAEGPNQYSSTQNSETVAIKPEPTGTESSLRDQAERDE